jgi:hypothetical protein
MVFRVFPIGGYSSGEASKSTESLQLVSMLEINAVFEGTTQLEATLR